MDELGREGLVRHVHRARGRASPRQFLGDNGPLAGRPSAPAIGLVDAQSEQPKLGQTRYIVGGKITAPVVPRSPRRENVIRKLPHRRAEKLFFFSWQELVHHCPRHYFVNRVGAIRESPLLPANRHSASTQHRV